MSSAGTDALYTVIETLSINARESGARDYAYTILSIAAILHLAMPGFDYPLVDRIRKYKLEIALRNEGEARMVRCERTCERIITGAARARDDLVFFIVLPRWRTIAGRCAIGLLKVAHSSGCSDAILWAIKRALPPAMTDPIQGICVDELLARWRSPSNLTPCQCQVARKRTGVKMAGTASWHDVVCLGHPIPQYSSKREKSLLIQDTLRFVNSEARDEARTRMQEDLFHVVERIGTTDLDEIIKFCENRANMPICVSILSFMPGNLANPHISYSMGREVPPFFSRDAALRYTKGSNCIPTFNRYCRILYNFPHIVDAMLCTDRDAMMWLATYGNKQIISEYALTWTHQVHVLPAFMQQLCKGQEDLRFIVYDSLSPSRAVVLAIMLGRVNDMHELLVRINSPEQWHKLEHRAKRLTRQSIIEFAACAFTDKYGHVVYGKCWSFLRIAKRITPELVLFAACQKGCPELAAAILCEYTHISNLTECACVAAINGNMVLLTMIVDKYNRENPPITCGTAFMGCFPDTSASMAPGKEIINGAIKDALTCGLRCEMIALARGTTHKKSTTIIKILKKIARSDPLAACASGLQRFLERNFP